MREREDLEDSIENVGEGARASETGEDVGERSDGDSAVAGNHGARVMEKVSVEGLIEDAPHIVIGVSGTRVRLADETGNVQAPYGAGPPFPGDPLRKIVAQAAGIRSGSPEPGRGSSSTSPKTARAG